MATIAASRIGSVIPWPVTIVIGNAKKLEEVRAILSSALFLFRSLKLDLSELQGEPEAISKEKARLAAI